MPQKIRRLYRSRKDRMLCGVCGGLAEYFEVDPMIVRLLWIVLTLLSLGAGIIAYLIACVIVPEKPR
jgi:phage shock protein PspC (stress-responsive transcriptional regulator)